mmetsp:Transcript_14076/g.38689  ORF Transcript_14076/g.38689 Transcript_14076/m.38689 type:complete len:168 (+) Transcript_14076:340-843(+)
MKKSEIQAKLSSRCAYSIDIWGCCEHLEAAAECMCAIGRPLTSFICGIDQAHTCSVSTLSAFMFLSSHTPIHQPIHPFDGWTRMRVRWIAFLHPYPSSRDASSHLTAGNQAAQVPPSIHPSNQSSNHPIIHQLMTPSVPAKSTSKLARSIYPCAFRPHACVLTIVDS